MRPREEAPVAEAAAADQGAAAADGVGGGGGGGDARNFPPENHCRSQVVPAPHTPHSPPPISKGY